MSNGRVVCKHTFDDDGSWTIESTWEEDPPQLAAEGQQGDAAPQKGADESPR